MRQYYYLVSSLPMLEFGMDMPFLYEEFLLRCEEQLSRQDMEIIKRVSISPSEGIEPSCPTLREWKRFDRTLRNEITRERANKKSKDPTKYIRGENYIDPFMERFAQWVVNHDSPLEAELSIDRFRWEKIVEIEKGHYFDIVYLITYALKLQILNRWARINSENGLQVLERLIEREIA